MLFTILAVLVALACLAASARRLYFAAEASGLDPRVLVTTLRGDRDRARTAWRAIEAEIAQEPAASWERELVEAVDARVEPAARVALVNEQLGELDYLAQRWSRVPRVCASVSASFGFMLASLALRDALASVDAVDVDGAVIGAINVVAVGLLGAVGCVAFQSRARHLTKERLAAVDKLVERLETLGPA